MGPLSLKIISYNVHWGLSTFRRHAIEERLVQTILREQCDLILLQELWLPEGEVLLSMLKHLEEEWEHRISGPTVRFGTGIQGNGLLSRFPFASWRNHPMPHHSHQDRALLHAIVAVPDGRDLHVVCTHFGLSHAERRAQTEDLFRYFDENIPPEQAVILGGDFNDWRGTLSHQFQVRLGLKEVFLSSRGRHAKTYPAIFPLLCLDRIYVRQLEIKSARVVHEAGWRGSSDHLPLAVEVFL